MTFVKIKKQKAQKVHMIKRKIQFKNYKNCLKAAESDNKKYMLKKTKLS